MIPLPKFTREEADKAWESWGFNCGPSALAVMLGLTPDEALKLLPGFVERGHYTNPTHVYAALKARNTVFVKAGQWPLHGLAFVGWSGPWSEPGRPARAAYRYTHWVATIDTPTGRGVWDINANTGDVPGWGWVSFEDWEKNVASHIWQRYKRATGYYFRVGVEIVL